MVDYDALSKQLSKNSNVYCDKSQVVIVLSNVFSNALAFTSKGGNVSVECSIVKQAVEVDAVDVEIPFLKISVCDSGIGFPPNEIKYAFDAFKKGSNSTFSEEAKKGAGLGLSLCSEIIHAHKGVMSAGNRINGGAIVSFTLPMQPIHVDEGEYALPVSPYLKHDKIDLRGAFDFTFPK